MNERVDRTKKLVILVTFVYGLVGLDFNIEFDLIVCE